MRRILKALSFLVYPLVFCFVITQLHMPAFAQEQITISTYYPSPYGSYRELSWGDTPPNAGRLTSEEGSSIELGGTTNSRPYIDFHRGPTAGTGSVDYNIRMMLSGSKALSFYESDGSTSSELVRIIDGSAFLGQAFEIKNGKNFIFYGYPYPQSPGNFDNPGDILFLDDSLGVQGRIWSKREESDAISRLYLSAGLDPSGAGNTPEITIEGTNRRIGINKASPRVSLDTDGDIMWGEGLLHTDQGGSIELGGVNRSTGGNMTPYIDFHNTEAPGGVDDDDYSSRIMASILGGEASLSVIHHTDPGASYDYSLRTRIYNGNDPVVLLNGWDFLDNARTGGRLLSGPVFTWQGLSLAVLATIAADAGLIAALVWLISSKKYKKDICPLAGSLDKIMKLRGVEFTWKNNNRRDTGLIAEEVVKIFPGSVIYEKDGKTISGYKPNSILGPLVEAIKEQQKQIEEQGAQIKKLEESVNNLKNRCDRNAR